MRIAVISDIHGNLEALSEVLADIEKRDVALVVSLGDNIGYGADSEEVVQRVRSMGIPSVMGNHELGIARPESLSFFNPSARESLLRTGELISAATREWLSGLPATLVLHGGLFVHGCPPDSINDYIFAVSDASLARRVQAINERICFIGHTHTLELVTLKGKRVLRTDLEPGGMKTDPDARYIVSAGSVGQPRDDKNNNAKYVIWDNSEDVVELRCVPYDIGKAAEKIIRLGFPRINATRLW